VAAHLFRGALKSWFVSDVYLVDRLELLLARLSLGCLIEVRLSGIRDGRTRVKT
jgi:hypothetical protein